MDNLRRVADAENVVAVGIGEKEAEGRPIGRLALTFYVASAGVAVRTPG